ELEWTPATRLPCGGGEWDPEDHGRDESVHRVVPRSACKDQACWVHFLERSGQAQSPGMHLGVRPTAPSIDGRCRMWSGCHPAAKRSEKCVSLRRPGAS